MYCCGFVVPLSLSIYIYIYIYLSFSLFCGAAGHVCRARHEKQHLASGNTDLWWYSKMVAMPDFGLERASSILAEILSICFHFLFPHFVFFYIMQPTTDNEQPMRPVQGACYKTGWLCTPYTPAARQQSLGATSSACAVVCPRCTAMASYYLVLTILWLFLVVGSCDL